MGKKKKKVLAGTPEAGRDGFELEVDIPGRGRRAFMIQRGEVFEIRTFEKCGNCGGKLDKHRDLDEGMLPRCNVRDASVTAKHYSGTRYKAQPRRTMTKITDLPTITHVMKQVQADEAVRVKRQRDAESALHAEILAAKCPQCGAEEKNLIDVEGDPQQRLQCASCDSHYVLESMRGKQITLTDVP